MLGRRALLVVVLCLSSLAASARAALVGTAFTFQGSLRDTGLPANGVYDLQFSLFYDPVNAVQAGVTLTVADVAVSGGLFTVTLDYGVGIIQTDLLYMQVGVRPGASAPGDPYTVLLPRQPLRPSPFALALALPYSVFFSSSSPIFSLSQNGTANAMFVLATGTGHGIQSNISNAANQSSAFFGATNGTGPAIAGTNTGLGRAATFRINNDDSTSFGVQVTTNGSGRALDVEQTRPLANEDAIAARTAGGGSGIYAVAEGSGRGVYGRAQGAGAALKGHGSGTSGTALELSSGAIKVLGAGANTATPVFIHTANSGNSTPCDGNGCFCYTTRVDNPFADGDPNAILIVTVNSLAGSGHPIVEQVKYESGKWYIETVFNEYFCHGQKFNVMIVKP